MFFSFFLKLFPEICILLKVDISSLECRIQSGLLLLLIILQALACDAAEYQDRRYVSYYHQSLCKVCSIPYETCCCDGAYEYEYCSAKSEYQEKSRTRVLLDYELQTAFAV